MAKKKADGILNEEETRRLERLVQVKQRLESDPGNTRPALGLPPPRPTDGKPVKPAESK